MNKITNRKSVLFLALAVAMAGCINDADVPSASGEDPTPGTETGKGNIAITFVVPNSSNGGRAAGDGTVEDSGIYDQGSAQEYKVKRVTLYLFDSDSKNLATTIKIEQTDLGNGTSTGGDSKEGKTIVYPCTKEITLKPGKYDILAVANGSRLSLEQLSSKGQLSSLLNHIDESTYEKGVITGVPEDGFVMTNRGSANMGVDVPSPEKSDTRTHVRINLERVVAKLMVGNTPKDEQNQPVQEEWYTLKNPEGKTYATVRLNNYKFVNLAKKFYTFRHVATFDEAAGFPSEPESYSVEKGNFNDIADGNGYVIDPYFFNKKPVEGETSDFTGGSFYFNHLSQQTGNDNWSGLAKIGEYASMYCLENCMFRPAQNTVYTTGVMLKGTFTPEPSQTIGDDGETVDNPSILNALYYFNYKFYTSLKAVGEHGDANIDGLVDTSDDKALEEKQIKRFTKNGGGSFSTYYNYWIKHYDNGSPTIMGVMEFGIVRNNIYQVNITKINGLGPGTPQTDPQPDENKALLTVEFGVFPWIVRDQDATLE